MDIYEALRDTENALRDFISSILEKKFANEWIAKCGVTEERVAVWKKRKETEERRQVAGTVEPRLIYYADFYDLHTILKKNWPDFTLAFGDYKSMDVWLDELEKMRDPNAHSRELLPHQKQLAFGISGEIRTKIVRYRSKLETSDDYFPRIESARDNYGNIYSFGKSKSLFTDTILRVRDRIEFCVTATDPMGEPLMYSLLSNGGEWTTESILSLDLDEDDIRRHFQVAVFIKSTRPYHASKNWDDVVEFTYQVLPPRDIAIQQTP